ncbi:MAG: HAD-IA family hydrolase [Leptolyngbyaceae cyanobacterium bins.349]|nr:HAD-IA family hydrolase [Leptolyngbyaceae cyanobacterium bins.349]
MKVIIFDFDGTIADSFETVLRISNQLAAEFGYPITRSEEITELKNLSSREVMQRARISPFKLPFLLLRLRRELNREIDQLHLIPGMKTSLLSLKQQGYALGIVTSNSRQNVNTFLQLQGLNEVFDFVDSGLALFGKGRIIQRLLKRHKLNSMEVIYVGDETRDIEAARKIGICAIAVSWGFNSSQALAAENPNALIHHPDELLSAIQQV